MTLEFKRYFLRKNQVSSKAFQFYYDNNIILCQDRIGSLYISKNRSCTEVHEVGTVANLEKKLEKMSGGGNKTERNLRNEKFL